jgi:hypothetical protein
MLGKVVSLLRTNVLKATLESRWVTMMGNTETQGNRFNQPISEGANVFDVNGEKVGSVSGYNAQGEYLTIQKGWLLTHDIYVPSNAIGRVVASAVHLNLSKDDLKDQRWATQPTSRPVSRAADMGLTGAPPAPEEGRVEPERGRMDLEQGSDGRHARDYWP